MSQVHLECYTINCFTEIGITLMHFQNQELSRQFKEKIIECQQLLETLDSSENDTSTAETDKVAIEQDREATEEDAEEADVSASGEQDADHSYAQSDADRLAYDQSEPENQSGYSQSGAEGCVDDEEYVTDEEEEMQLLFSKRATMFYEDTDRNWKVFNSVDLCN